MESEPHLVIRVARDKYPAGDLMIDPMPTQEKYLPQFHIRRGDFGSYLTDGVSRSQILIKSFKRYFKQNPNANFRDLIRINFTEDEANAWQQALPHLDIQEIASWKRWGFSPETAALFNEYGIRTGHNVYDLVGSADLDIDYFMLCRSYILTGSNMFKAKVWGKEASRVYMATYRELAMARELFSDDGHELSDDELMDYIGFADVSEGSGFKTVARVPAVLALSMKRNGVPPEYLKIAWNCGFKDYVSQVRLIDAFMKSEVTVDRLKGYHEVLVAKGRTDDVAAFIEMSKSGIPFEYLEVIL